MALMKGMFLPLDDFIKEWLDEDIPTYDIGGAVVGDAVQSATIYAKASLTLAGVPFVDALLKYLGCSITWNFPEGADVTVLSEKVPMATVTGPIYRVLQAERTVLEVLVRSSAIATLARRAKKAAESVGYKGVIAGTRKTTPGRFRLVEKYALMVAGVDTHRYSLSDMVMLKDNHIDACGSITLAVKRAKPLSGFSMKIEVECRSEEDAVEALEAGADIVMLDNFDHSAVGPCAQRLKQKYPHAIIEISGGINANNVANFVRNAPQVDVVSMGSLTQGVPSVDISMKVSQTGVAK